MKFGREHCLELFWKFLVEIVFFSLAKGTCRISEKLVILLSGNATVVRRRGGREEKEWS